MKNRIAIYFSVMAMILVASSCSNDTEEVTSPYAYIASFGIGDIRSSYPTFAKDGSDSTEVKTISFASYPFTIDQSSGEIYNVDSLLYATDVSKVVLNMTIEGVASIFNEATGVYDYVTTGDSLDFTSPRKVRITSTDGSYNKDYRISINVHQVEPELMVWDKVASAVVLNPEKAVEYNGDVLVFGKTEENVPVFQSMDLNEKASWSALEYPALPETVDFSTLHLWNGRFYVLAGGDLYSSDDAKAWQPVIQDNNLLALIGASDANGFLWVANADSIRRSADGVSFEPVSLLPDGFPLYELSTSSYALSHNENIVRYMVVGYTDEDLKTAPKVWSMLSNEGTWVEYANVDNPYPCPSLAGLAVVRYDNFLYAFGGKGVAVENGAETDVEAFSSFYISKDNGVVWKAPESFYQRLPKELKGVDAGFVTFVDSDNYIWIITSDDGAGVWRGMINRLGFKR